jgi:hypothetical protein
MNGSGWLTWYPGSILPYASLWHILQRVIALNRLGMGELPRHPHAWLNRFTTRPKHNLLFNEPDPIDTAALAAWLGEPAQALRWSHMGAVAPWLRFLFTPGMRVCPLCLGAGYHSALLSLRLLPACPIHAVALRSQCDCGRPFTAALTGQSCCCAGGCPCGRLTFFTRQTCRRPTLDAASTTAFEPVVAWLQQCSAVITWRPQAQAAQGGDNAMWMDSIAQWGAALGIAYPAVFEQPRVRGQYQVSVHRSRGAAAPGLQQPQPDREPQAWVSPACAVYQAMARHLRRHVVRRSDAWMAKFMQSAHPLHIARMLAGRRCAVLSLAEALWARQAEAGVEQRRWPYRPAAAALLPLHERLLRDGLVLDHQAQSPPLQERLDEHRRRWLEYHAAGTMLATLWGHALSRAVMACRTGLADWQPNCCSLSRLCGCAAVVEPDGRLRFVSIRACGTAVRMPSLPDKAQRRHAAGVAPHGGAVQRLPRPVPDLDRQRRLACRRVACALRQRLQAPPAAGHCSSTAALLGLPLHRRHRRSPLQRGHAGIGRHTRPGHRGAARGGAPARQALRCPGSPPAPGRHGR